MKICILGPVTTSKYFGGVAIFDEGLAKGFCDNGCEAFIVTNQKEAKERTEINIPLYVVNAINFKKIMVKEKPDYIIAQLGYAKYLLFTHVDGKKIYFLHAFFKQSYYGVIKSVLAVIYQKILISRCNWVFSNSYFTEMINNDFFGIKSNAVFHIGVADEFYRKVTLSKNVRKVPRTIFFAGRFVPAKGAGILIEVAKELTERKIDYHFYLAGDGPEKNKLEKKVKESNLSVEFLGRIDQEKIVEYYQKAEIFISLDPSEPFGIVFAEALLCDCKIVCPITGGQVEFLNNHMKSVAYVDIHSANSIADGIEFLFLEGRNPNLSNKQKDNFTYKNVAKKMIKYWDENE